MEEFRKFAKDEDKLTRVGLIAISLIILQDWISLGVNDIASFISLLALAISLPILGFDLLLIQIPKILSISKRWRYFININRVVGPLFSGIGIVAAIWHASWVAGIMFMLCGLYCFVVYIVAYVTTEKTLIKFEE